jgi:hypothetical protein
MSYNRVARGILIGLPPILVGAGMYWLSKQTWTLAEHTITGNGILTAIGTLFLLGVSLLVGLELADELRG